MVDSISGLAVQTCEAEEVLGLRVFGVALDDLDEEVDGFAVLATEVENGCKEELCIEVSGRT